MDLKEKKTLRAKTLNGLGENASLDAETGKLRERLSEQGSMQLGLAGKKRVTHRWREASAKRHLYIGPSHVPFPEHLTGTTT